jgi:hypothetical protein
MGYRPHAVVDPAKALADVDREPLTARAEGGPLRARRQRAQNCLSRLST